MSIIAMYLVFAMLAVLWLDITRFIIPNWLVGSLLLVYPVAVWMHPQPINWPMALLALFIVFAVGYFLFSMKWMGGGDVKLLAAIALWIGLSMELMMFLFEVSVIGGIFSLALIVGRNWAPLYIKSAQEKPLPRLLQMGAPMPYGVAIALAFLHWIFANQVPVLSLH